jgi:demethylmenaquinone methyltransferase / 2-methoxy-6-polyprenyl-1,4-benzoquinol methylase
MSNLPTQTEKSNYVHSMFGSIAAKYDLLNDVMTVGLHRLWKREVCRSLEINENHKVLDLCCGTGDLTCLLAIQSKALAVTGLDFSAEMLSYANKRLKSLHPTVKSKTNFLQGDALKLPFADSCFDRCSISFGLRNVSDYLACLQECKRVLKPQGKLVILDLSHPAPIWDWASRPIRFWILPILGKLLAGNASAYSYLPNSIKIYPNQDKLAKPIQEAGFAKIKYKNIFGGLLAMHEGWVN